MNCSIVPTVNGVIDNRDCGYYLMRPFVFDGIGGDVKVGKRAQVVGVSAGRRQVRGASTRRLSIVGGDTGRRQIKGNT